MKKLLNYAVIFIISILLFEILLYLIFYSPIRFYYPLGNKKVDIQTDFNVIYNVDWRTGNRLIKCNNSKDKNQKVVFIGDSFAFGQGLKEEDTFVNPGIANVPSANVKDPVISKDELNVVSKSVTNEEYTLFGFVVILKICVVSSPPPLLEDSLVK